MTEAIETQAKVHAAAQSAARRPKDFQHCDRTPLGRPDPLNGFRPEHVAEVVYVIARKAGLLRDLLECVIDDTKAPSPQLHAAHSISELIGAMADHISQAVAYEGNVLTWTVGEEIEPGSAA